MKKITKKQYNMFGKEIYLIGLNEQGEKVFLEHPSWDCGWYWGFGFLETYTNNRQITRSSDISSHSHFTDFDNNNSLNSSHTLVSCVLDSKELLELKILMDIALILGLAARVTKTKEYKNICEVHNKIITLLS